MEPLRVLSASEQVAAYLRRALLRGEWGGRIPGGNQLAKDLGTGRNTVEAALQLLEDEGLLVPQGRGRSRKFDTPRGPGPAALRVGILTGDKADRGTGYMVELHHELIEAGHTVFFAPKTLSDLKLRVRSIATMVKKNPADAWLVLGGSRGVLEWFVAGNKPVFALFGRRRELPIASAGPDKVPAMTAATRELVRLGHRRIVLLARQVRRLPVPGTVEQSFLDELARCGIQTGPYNLPDWEETVIGFYARLASLFHVTPPSALIVEEVTFFLAVQQFLVEQGIRVPHDVSLICTDGSPDFAWCRPMVTHIRWDSRPLVRRIVQWAANVSRGMDDQKQTFTAAEFMPGGTIGPVNGE